jgi:hypothetical protein
MFLSHRSLIMPIFCLPDNEALRSQLPLEPESPWAPATPPLLRLPDPHPGGSTDPKPNLHPPHLSPQPPFHSSSLPKTNGIRGSSLRAVTPSGNCLDPIKLHYEPRSWPLPPMWREEEGPPRPELESLSVCLDPAPPHLRPPTERDADDGAWAVSGPRSLPLLLLPDLPRGPDDPHPHLLPSLTSHGRTKYYY